MRHVEAPHEIAHPFAGPLIFLAGGITGCPDWQAEVITKLADCGPGVLANPRRSVWPIDDPMASEAQIAWEHAQLSKADAVLFWFPKETVCPIALFELGCMAKQFNKLFVGTHPDYARKVDVVTQLRLRCPELIVFHSLEDLLDQVRAYAQDCEQEAWHFWRKEAEHLF